MKKTALIIIIIFVIFFLPWYLGGIHLKELKITGMEKAENICSSNIVEQGYQRSIICGFGGTRWYQCKIDGILYQFAVTRRINSSETQVYNLEQMNTFPNNFKLNN